MSANEKFAMPLAKDSAVQLWATLGEQGKAPAELALAREWLGSYSVGVENWVERIARKYLRATCLARPAFKLVVAMYGGGKTHFLMSTGARGLDEGFAVAYIACTPAVSFEHALNVYRVFVKNLQLPSQKGPGLRVLLRSVVVLKRQQIELAGAGDPDRAFEAWLRSEVLEGDFEENAFGRVMAAALRGVFHEESGGAGDAAYRWLQGDCATLSKDEMAFLGLAKPSGVMQAELGRSLMLSMVQFVSRHSGAKGVVVLFDEVETLTNQSGKALGRVLAAMRVLVDMPAGVSGALPMLVLFSVVPDALEKLKHYPALEQRFKALGATFHDGNDVAPQIDLSCLGETAGLLEMLGAKLVRLGANATGYVFNEGLQRDNIERLARIAAGSFSGIAAQRLFIKACVGLLEMQRVAGERLFSEDELLSRYAGTQDTIVLGDGEAGGDC